MPNAFHTLCIHQPVTFLPKLLVKFGSNQTVLIKNFIETTSTRTFSYTLPTTSDCFYHPMCLVPHCSGEFKTGASVLTWLTDEENRELSDEIEHVNPAMLDQLLDKSIYLATLFCESCLFVPCLRYRFFQLRICTPAHDAFE